jgi:hypothetical protein
MEEQKGQTETLLTALFFVTYVLIVGLVLINIVGLPLLNPKP